MSASPPPRDAARARRDLGLVVHVHQGRRARARAGDADRRPARARGAHARRCSCRSRSAPARRVRQLRATGSGWLVVGALNTAIPFWLLSWGETRIDSGLAAILQASAPLFTALLAFVAFREERVTGLAARRRRWSASSASRCSSARSRRARCSAPLAVVGWRSATALGGLLTGRYLKPARPIVVSLRLDRGRDAASRCRSASPRRRAQMPGWKTIGSRARPRRPRDGARLPPLLRPDRRRRRGLRVLVTYLVPPIALVYGAIFLGERFGASALRRPRADPRRRRARHRQPCASSGRGSRSRPTASTSSPRRRASRRTAGSTRSARPPGRSGGASPPRARAARGTGGRARCSAASRS